MKTSLFNLRQKFKSAYLNAAEKLKAIKSIRKKNTDANKADNGKLQKFIARHAANNENQTIPQTNIQEKDELDSMESVDIVSPIICSFVGLLHLKGLQVSPQVLMDGLVTNARPNACLQAAKRFGVSGAIVKKDSLQDISQMLLPCIVLLKQERSVILLATKEGFATIIQPEHGEPTRIPLEVLEKEYLGYAIFLKTKERVDSRVSSLAIFKAKQWFWDVLFFYWPIYKHVIIASFSINIIGIAGSLYAMNVYDRVVPNSAVYTLWALTFGVLLAYISDFILRNLRSYFVDLAGKNADIVLSGMLIDKVLRMKLDKKPDSTGVLVNNIREFDSLREFFSSSTLLTIVDLPFLIIFLVLVAFIGGTIVLVPMAATPLVVGIGIWTHIKIKRSSEQNFQQNMQKNAFLVEMINGLETIRCSSAEMNTQRSWERIVGASALASSQTRKYAAIASSFTSSLTQIVTVCVIVWGVYKISEGTMTMGGLIASNILVGRAMAPLMQITSIFGRLQQSHMALNALNLLMETPSETSGDHINVDFGSLKPGFALENVSFSYPNSKKKLLDRVSLKINPGERVAIMGRVGSGKSTLGKLLMGLYEPNEGSVRLDGIDIRQMSKVDIRSRIGFMPQETTLFYGSIRDNIALRDPSVSDQEVLKVAEIAGVTTFTRDLSAGLGEHIGERGMLLSGGQRQSIALARALLHDPNAVILDEPTSNMDSATIAYILTKLRPVLSGKTLLLITHRFRLLELVDRIIVINSGAVVADAPRDEVLKSFYNVDPDIYNASHSNKKNSKFLISSRVSPKSTEADHGKA